MYIDVINRVKKTNLPVSRWLQPLFEAVVNAIHAIEDRNDTQQGRITIRIKREISSQVNELPLIKSIIIEDNGVGFTDENFRSFERWDSSLKMDRGCKGTGRFCWLVAFESVRISSIYLDSSKYKKRTFEFKRTEDGIENFKDEALQDGEKKSRKTTIELRNLQSKYNTKSGKYDTERIAEQIIQYCLIYFIGDRCPIIEIHDIDNRQIIVNDLFKLLTKEQTENFNFKIEG